MTDIAALFHARDQQYGENTMAIFKHIDVALTCITDFLNKNDPIFAAAEVTWEDANIADEMLTIMGMVDFIENTTVEVDGETITITANNKAYFQRVVHMTLPFDIVMEGDPENITKFLTEMKRQDDEQLEDVLTEQLDGIKEEIGSNNTHQAFDLTLLTDEQRNSLMLTNKGKH